MRNYFLLLFFNLRLHNFFYYLCVCVCFYGLELTVITFCPITVKFGNFREGLFSRSFVKMKSSRFRANTLSFTDTGKSWPSREFLASQICLLSLFAIMKFSRIFPNLQ